MNLSVRAILIVVQLVTLISCQGFYGQQIWGASQPPTYQQQRPVQQSSNQPGFGGSYFPFSFPPSGSNQNTANNSPVGNIYNDNRFQNQPVYDNPFIYPDSSIYNTNRYPSTNRVTSRPTFTNGRKSEESKIEKRKTRLIKIYFLDDQVISTYLIYVCILFVSLIDRVQRL